MRIRTRLGDERGVFLVTAAMVIFILFLLGAAVISISLHNSAASGTDRKRLQAVNAAEAGINYYVSQLESAKVTSAPCVLTGTVASVPQATFTVFPTFYNTSTSPATALACPPPETANAVTLRSVGYANVSASCPPASLTSVPPAPCAPRTVESYVGLTAIVNGIFPPSAIYTYYDSNFKGNAQVLGSLYNDATVYAGGNVTTSANATFNGDLIAAGSIVLGSGGQVKGSVLGGGAVTLSGNSTIGKNVTSSTSSATLQSGSTVYGSVRAGTGITVANNAKVYGTTIPNSPSTAPYIPTYPVYTFVQTDWVNAGYQIQTYSAGTASDCTNAVNFIAAITTGSWVVRVPTNCTMTFNQNITLHGNLAIFNGGPIALNTPIRFSPAAGTGPWNLYFFAGMMAQSGCGLTTNTNTGVDAGINTLIYTPPGTTTSPCTVTMSSNSGLAAGQIFAGSVNWLNNTVYSYKQVLVPGQGTNGYYVNQRCFREVVTGSSLPPVPAC